MLSSFAIYNKLYTFYFVSFGSGTCKTAEPYKVGKKMTDILLEILNLNKTEIVSMDIISNQEFTEVIKACHVI
jgi:hypothetical protein